MILVRLAARGPRWLDDGMHDPCQAACSGGQGPVRGRQSRRVPSVPRSRPTHTHYWHREWAMGPKATSRVSSMRSNLERESPLYAHPASNTNTALSRPTSHLVPRREGAFHNFLLRLALCLRKPSLPRSSIAVQVYLKNICLLSSAINNGRHRELDISSGSSGGECVNSSVYS